MASRTGSGWRGERARSDTMRALREKFGDEKAEKIWADFVGGVRREVAQAVVEAEAAARERAICDRTSGCALLRGHPGRCRPG